FLLEFSRVKQHDLHKIGRGGGTIDRAIVSVSHKLWDIPAVVDVRVADYHRVDSLYVHGEGLPVSKSERFHPLEKAAIQQEPKISYGEQVSRTGHTTCASEKFQAYIHSLFSYVKVVEMLHRTLLDVK